MAKQITLDEMLEILQDIAPDSASRFQAAIESIGELMAVQIAQRLDLNVGPCTFQGTAFSGTCAPFTPKTAGQPIPAEIANYDADVNSPEEGWEPIGPGTIYVPLSA